MIEGASPIHPQGPERKRFSPLIFIPEVDHLGNGVRADNSQIKLKKSNDWTTLLVLYKQHDLKRTSSLAIVRPDNTDQTVAGQAWFVYGDEDTGLFHIAATSGSFDVPKSSLLIGKSVPTSILSFIPSNDPDLKISDEKKLQPIAFITRDSFGDFVISRRYWETVDGSSNTIKLQPSSFEFTYPHAVEKKAAAEIIAEWKTEIKQQDLQIETEKEISKLARITALRLAHKTKHLPHELKPVCSYDKTSHKYTITMKVSTHGKNQILGKGDPIGKQFGFGERLAFVRDESDQESGVITGSFTKIKYSQEGKSERKLAEKVTIESTQDTLKENLQYDRIGGPIFNITFSSIRPDDIINILVGIERGLKPRYLPKDEING